MSGLSHEKPVFVVLCILTAVSAAVSGSIYPSWAGLFNIAVVICFFLSFSGAPAPSLASAWPAWAFVGVLYLSSLWSVNLNAALNQAFFFTGFALFSYLVAFSAREGRARIMLNVVLWVAVAVSLYGIYQYTAGFYKTQDYIRAYGASEFGMSVGKIKAVVSKLEYRRAFSTLFSPNALACYLAMAMPAGMVSVFKSRSLVERAIYAAALTVMLVALVLTKSVGGLVAFAAGALTFSVAVTASWPKRRVGGLAGLIAVTLLITAISGYAVLSQRADLLRGVGRSYADRICYFDGALNSFFGSPLAGKGAGTFSITYLEWIKPGGGESRFAHNIALQAMSETGILGLAALAVLFGVFAVRCVRGMRAEPSDPVYPAALAGGAAFLAHNMVDFTFYVHETSLLFWLYFGLVSARAGEASGRLFRYRSAIITAAVAAALMFCILYGISLVASWRHADAVGVLEAHGMGSAAKVRSKPAPEEAVSLAEESVRLKPFDDYYRSFLGNLYEGMGYAKGPEYALKAEMQYLKAIELNPLYPYHQRDLGILYMKLGKTADARLRFKEAARLYPANKEFQRHLTGTEN